MTDKVCYICGSTDIVVLECEDVPGYDTLGCMDCGAIGNEYDFDPEPCGELNPCPGDVAARDSL